MSAIVYKLLKAGYIGDYYTGVLNQGVFLWTLRVCILGFWVSKSWNMALNKGIWDPKLRGTNIKGTNLKCLT